MDFIFNKLGLNIGRNAWAFLSIGLLLQIITYHFSNDTLLSFISGSLGVFAVVFCSQRKLISYVFGIAQLVTYLVIVWQECLWAKVGENIFYLITMFIGFFIWNNHYESDKVETKKLTLSNILFMICGTVAGSFLVGYGLTFTNDAHPYFDAFTTLPAFIAQFLMIFRYREQWLFWLIIDLGCLILWIIIGNWCMVAQYVFWIANCFYGWYKWSNYDTN
jgi:nicotinamide mononucleotide transporter